MYEISIGIVFIGIPKFEKKKKYITKKKSYIINMSLHSEEKAESLTLTFNCEQFDVASIVAAPVDRRMSENPAVDKTELVGIISIFLQLLKP